MSNKKLMRIVVIVYIILVLIMLSYNLLANIVTYSSFDFIEHVTTNIEQRVIEVYDSNLKLFWDQFRLDLIIFNLQSKTFITIFWGVTHLFLIPLFVLNKYDRRLSYLSTFYALWMFMFITQMIWGWITTFSGGLSMWIIGKMIELPLIYRVLITERSISRCMRKIGNKMKRLVILES